MTAPKCMYCGKPLKKFTVSLESRDPALRGRNDPGPPARGDRLPMPQGWQDRLGERGIVVSVKRSHSWLDWLAGVWDGKSYGLQGEGLFCSKTICAYQYARRMAKLVKTQQKKERK